MATLLTPQCLHLPIGHLMTQMIGLHMVANWNLKLLSFYFPMNRCQLVTLTLYSISGPPRYSNMVTSHLLLPTMIYTIQLMRLLLVTRHGRDLEYIIMALNLKTMYHLGWMPNTKSGFIIHAPLYTTFYLIWTLMVNLTMPPFKNMTWKVTIALRTSCQAIGCGNRW